MSAEEAMVEVRQKLQDTLLKGLGKAEEYGLFLANKEDPKKGVWLDKEKSLSYYMLENRVRNIFEPTHNGFQCVVRKKSGSYNILFLLYRIHWSIARGYESCEFGCLTEV